MISRRLTQLIVCCCSTQTIRIVGRVEKQRQVDKMRRWQKYGRRDSGRCRACIITRSRVCCCTGRVVRAATTVYRRRCAELLMRLTLDWIFDLFLTIV